MPEKKEEPLLQLKVTLVGVKPPIWRRIVVPASYHLGHLHQIVQLAMGWNDSHLHQFRIGMDTYSQPVFELEWAKDENRMTLAKLFPTFTGKVGYEYDFGDGWEHEILCEGLPKSTPSQIPFCLTGRRNCPPDDVGGVFGYFDFLDAMSDSEHEEHEDRLAWYGGEFDPESFDRERVNELLAAWLKAGRKYPPELLGE